MKVNKINKMWSLFIAIMLRLLTNHETPNNRFRLNYFSGLASVHSDSCSLLYFSPFYRQWLRALTWIFLSFNYDRSQFTCLLYTYTNTKLRFKIIWILSVREDEVEEFRHFDGLNFNFPFMITTNISLVHFKLIESA